jgi:uncharacterized protein (TIGR03437 family)
MLQVTVRVPAGLTAGQAAMQLSVGGVAAPAITIWVK